MLDDILVIVLRNLTAAPSEFQAAVQRHVLDVLAQQIMLSGTASSMNMELRRVGLETLHQILQASGHTLLVGWETIFEVLGSVCQPAPSDPASYLALPRRPPPLGYLQEKGCSALIKIAFQWNQCMTLMCDAFAVLSPPALHQHARAVRPAGSHEHRADGGQEPLLGRLRHDTGEAPRGGPQARGLVLAWAPSGK